MKWIEAGDILINSEKVLFVMKCLCSKDNIFSLKFHYALDDVLELRFSDEKLMHEFYKHIQIMINDGKCDLGASA